MTDSAYDRMRRAFTIIVAFIQFLLISSQKYVDLDSEVVVDSLISLNHDSDMRKYFVSDSRSRNSITVILTQYNRNDIKAQLDAVMSQSVSINRIYINQNGDHADSQFLENYGFDYCQRFESVACKQKPHVSVLQIKPENFRYHGRFSVPLLIDTEYAVIFDDDIMPRPNFIENCLRVSKMFNAVCGSQGEMLAPDRRIAVLPPLEDDLEVDFVGRTWLFRREWISSLWSQELPTFSRVEDISFAMSVWKNGGIRSFVARQRGDEEFTWGQTRHYDDDYQSSNQSSRNNQVSEMMRWAVGLYWIQAGYVPLAMRQAISTQLTKDCEEIKNGNTALQSVSGWEVYQSPLATAATSEASNEVQETSSRSASAVAVVHRCHPPWSRATLEYCPGASSPHTARILDLVRANGYLPPTQQLLGAYAAAGNDIAVVSRSFISAAPRDVLQTLFLR